MVTILGQGLAGTTLAWQCQRAGLPFHVIDSGEPVTASRVAAGLVTPVAGQRFALAKDMAVLLRELREFHAHVASVLGRSFYREVPHVRLPDDECEAAFLRERLRDPELADYCDPIPPELPPCVDAPFGGVTLRQSGFLAVAEFLDASRSHFHGLGRFTLGKADDSPRAGPVVHCLGPWGADTPPFDWGELRFAHGDVLGLAIPGLREDRVLNRRCWILPQGNGRYLAGSTYLRGRGPVSEPSPEGRRDLEDRLRRMLRCPFEVIAHRAAVRPVSLDRRPVIQRHPTFRDTYCFNGLGSKGALTAPFHARRFVQELQRTLGPLDSAPGAGESTP